MRLIAILIVVALADKMTQAFPGRFFLLMGTFGDMVELLAERGIASIDGIVLDIGVSSMQIDTPRARLFLPH